jgi:hypothetical protein
MLLIGVYLGAALFVVYAFVRWMLAPIVPARAFARFERGVGHVFRIYFLVTILGFVAVMIYIINFYKP